MQTWFDNLKQIRLRDFKISLISYHLIKTFTFPFLSGTLFFTSIMLIFYLKEIIKSAIEKGIAFSMIMQLLLYSTNWTLGLTIPMAALMAIIIAINNLNSDSEIIAMRSGGVSNFRLFRPMLAVGILMTIFLFYFNHKIVPQSLRFMLDAKRVILTFDPIAVIEPGKFTTLDKSEGLIRHIYIEKIIRKNAKDPGYLQNVQIRSTESVNGHFTVTEVINAKTAIRIQKKAKDGQWRRSLRLQNGQVFRRNAKDKTYQSIDFTKGSFDINILDPPRSNHSLETTDPQAMFTADINREIARHSESQNQESQRRIRELSIEKHKRVAISFSFLLFMFLGFPLGIVNKRSGKGVGFGISIVFIFVYYFLFFSGGSMANANIGLPVWLLAWMANLVTLIAGSYFYYQRMRDF